MPKISDRQRLLRDVIELHAVAALQEDDDDMLELQHSDNEDERLLFSEADDVSDLLLLIESRRYLVERERAIQCTVFLVDVFRYSIPQSQFRTLTRMDRASFERLIQEIQGNSVFYNKSTFSQTPVWKQLAVALDRFANYGTGASLNRCMRMWAIGKGTVDDYTDRVVTALNALTERYVRWPSTAERKQLSKRMAALGFRGWMMRMILILMMIGVKKIHSRFGSKSSNEQLLKGASQEEYFGCVLNNASCKSEHAALIISWVSQVPAPALQEVLSGLPHQQLSQ
ncbi:unnamed protein product [Phytophthora lilii]|uniref:Unnamed protein product n=1 Tax=Phytophthora lilii TaxID=2077276 RepID=A0A9W6TT89_9STRA|nr:unnamed protein product [Phytophthora lilii]